MKQKTSLWGHGAVEKSMVSPLVIPPPPASNTWAIVLLGFMIIGWIGILFFESTRPSANFLEVIPQLDKVAHMGAFGILGLLVCGLSLKLRPRPRIPLFSMPLLVVTLCGVTEECIQMFVPGRMASIWDVLADMAGAIFAILLVNLVMRLYQKGEYGNF